MNNERLRRCLTALLSLEKHMEAMLGQVNITLEKEIGTGLRIRSQHSYVLKYPERGAYLVTYGVRGAIQTIEKCLEDTQHERS